MFSVEMRKIFTQTNLIQTASLFKLLGCFLFDFWVKVVGIRAEGVRIASMLRQQFKNLKPTTVPCWQDNWTLKIIRKYLHASERRLDEQWANKTFLVMHTTSQCRGHAHRSNYVFLCWIKAVAALSSLLFIGKFCLLYEKIHHLTIQFNQLT